MDFDFIEWDEEDDPRGNTWHIADNGLSIDEVEEVMLDPGSLHSRSRSSRRPGVIGRTSLGKEIMVIHESSKDAGINVVRPVTAYEIKD